MGFPRQEYRCGWTLSPPGDLPEPGIKPASLASPALAGGFFTTSTTWNSLSRLSLEYTCIVPPLLPPALPWAALHPFPSDHCSWSPPPPSSLPTTHSQRDLISDPVLVCTETSSGSHLPTSQSTPSPYKTPPRLHSSQESKTKPTPLALATESWLSWASCLPPPPLTTFWSLFCCTYQARPSSGCCTGSSICLVPLFEAFRLLLIQSQFTSSERPDLMYFPQAPSCLFPSQALARSNIILFFIPFPLVSATRVSAPRGQRLWFRAEFTACAPYGALKE